MLKKSYLKVYFSRKTFCSNGANDYHDDDFILQTMQMQINETSTNNFLAVIVETISLGNSSDILHINQSNSQYTDMYRI
jgi:hypothetical protein